MEDRLARIIAEMIEDVLSREGDIKVPPALESLLGSILGATFSKTSDPAGLTQVEGSSSATLQPTQEALYLGQQSPRSNAHESSRIHKHQVLDYVKNIQLDASYAATVTDYLKRKSPSDDTELLDLHKAMAYLRDFKSLVEKSSPELQRKFLREALKRVRVKGKQVSAIQWEIESLPDNSGIYRILLEGGQSEKGVHDTQG